MKMINKICNKSGESLIEVLAGTVIISLASVIFVSLVNSASNINHQTEKHDDDYYAAKSNLEYLGNEDDVEPVTDSVLITDDETSESSAATVLLYRQDNMYVYQESVSTTPEGGEGGAEPN